MATDFQLSRIQAEGWNATNKLVSEKALALDAAALGNARR